MELKIKRRPVNKPKFIRTVGVAAFSGILFGLIAALVFIFVLDGVGYVKEKNPPAIIIQTEGEETNSGVDDSAKEPNNTRKSDDEVDRKQALYRTAEAVEKAVVRINVRMSESYTGKRGESNVKTGIIFSKNTKMIYCLTTPDAARGLFSVDVTFSDGTTVEGKVVETDYISGLSVLKIDATLLSTALYDSIIPIEVANSNKAMPGDLVVAVGNVMGTGVSSLAGAVVSTDGTFSCTDGELLMIETDIPSRTNTNGFLINEEGMMVGVISHGADVSGQVNMINAYGCSDLTTTIYKLTEGSHFPYMGIKTKTIDYKMAGVYGVPLGVFVSLVEVDSPALEAGFQQGDIIVAAGETAVLSGRRLHSLLMGVNLDKSSERNVTFRVLRLVEGEYETKQISVTLMDRY